MNRVKTITVTHADGTTNTFPLTKNDIEVLDTAIESMVGVSGSFDYLVEDYGWTDRQCDRAEDTLNALSYALTVKRPNPKTEKQKFVGYCLDFYGTDGCYADDFETPFTFEEIERAYDVIRDNPLHDWDGGCTHDREATCDLIQKWRRV